MTPHFPLRRRRDRTALLFPALALAAAFFAGCSRPPETTTPPDSPTPLAAAQPPPGQGAPTGGSVAGTAVTMPDPPGLPPEVVPSRKPDRKLKVGVSLLTRVHDFYKDMEAAMREEAEKQGITLLIQAAEGDAAVEQRQVQTMLSQGVDALILCPVNSQGSGSTVRLANDAKVPVFTADIASKSGDVVCHVASNNEQGGELVGEFLAKKLHGQGEIAIVDFPTVTSVQERVRGFEKAIARYPGIKVVARPAPDMAVQAKVFPLAQDLLQSRPQLKGIFAINDDSALGVVQAASGPEWKDLVVVGFDGTTRAVNAIRTGGVLKADAAQFPGVIGRAVVSAVAKHSLGEPVPRSVPIPTGLISGP